MEMGRQLGGQKEREEKLLEKELRRINEYAEARADRLAALVTHSNTNHTKNNCITAMSSKKITNSNLQSSLLAFYNTVTNNIIQKLFLN